MQLYISEDWQTLRNRSNDASKAIVTNGTWFSMLAELWRVKNEPF